MTGVLQLPRTLFRHAPARAGLRLLANISAAGFRHVVLTDDRGT